jgi:hypothetical protein
MNDECLVTPVFVSPESLSTSVGRRQQSATPFSLTATQNHVIFSPPYKYFFIVDTLHLHRILVVALYEALLLNNSPPLYFVDITMPL